MTNGENSEGPDWSRIDLNLFIPLNALLLERSVTKAAERIFITQPSMSAALAKLRRVFDDPLLVRDGRETALTPFAETLRRPVQQMLYSARDMLTHNQTFDPAVHRRSFTIMASDYVATVLLAPLVPRLLAEAPGVQIRIEYPRSDLVDFLRSGRCDLLFWPTHIQTPDLHTFHSEDLFNDEFVVVTSNDTSFAHLLTDEGPTAVPGVRFCPATGSDEALDPITSSVMKTPTAATVSSFSLALEMVSAGGLVTTVQRRLFALKQKALALREVPVDVPLPHLAMKMHWHPRAEKSPAHMWLRSRVRQAAAELGATDSLR